MTYALLAAAFMMGIFGSPHCLGMCGGLVTAFGLSMQSVSPAKRRWLIGTYHFGRILSYALLGVVAGFIGTAILQPLMVGNATPRILLGLVLVFIGMAMLGAPFLNKLEKVGMGLWSRLAPLRKKVFPLVTFPRALAAGLLWGFLPCGLVYGALMMAIVGHNVPVGAMLMFAFGLGTIPMLVATQTTVAWMHDRIGRFHLRQLNGSMMVLSGIAIIVVPMLMMNMHGGHSMHGEHSMHGDAMMDDSSHAAHMMSSDTITMPDTTEMSHHEHMNHPMPTEDSSDQ